VARLSDTSRQEKRMGEAAAQSPRPRRRTPAAAYQFAYRDRLRRGERVLRPTVNFYEFVDTLIAAGWLNASQALDAKNVNSAASEVLAL
jgi:hypothetical protein